MKLIPCYCEKEVEFDFPEEVDISSDPKIVDAIMDGTFMSVRCPYCGKLLKPEEPVRIFDSRGSLDVRMVPELQRNAFLTGRYKAEAPRVAIGFPELVEKIAIYMAGLDDGTVEVLKLPAIQRDSPEDLSIYFNNLEDNNLIFHIHGMEPGKIGVTRISRDLYERTLRSLENTKDSVFREVITPPYVSVKKLYRED
ncbi:MAG: hypothetical protein JW760_06635 [Spirochaetales bacterium]|nr:hypothetical protein [Spirochaetales bacterium]